MDKLCCQGFHRPNSCFSLLLALRIYFADITTHEELDEDKLLLRPQHTSYRFILHFLMATILMFPLGVIVVFLQPRRLDKRRNRMLSWPSHLNNSAFFLLPYDTDSAMLDKRNRQKFIWIDP